MNANEIELLSLVRDNNNPDQALVISINIILDYLKQHESFEEQAVADLRELV